MLLRDHHKDNKGYKKILQQHKKQYLIITNESPKEVLEKVKEII